ncbi:MAG: zinc ribbon domain-containing protein [Candidatus Brocadiae bacterium]|nr:zinc ribbon domain-containing protein [Candidatus Brocadiia bacterium]
MVETLCTKCGGGVFQIPKAERRVRATCPHCGASRKPRKATKKQRDYLLGLGFDIDEDVLFHEASTLLTGVDEVKFFFYGVFRDLVGCTCSNAGLTGQDTAPAIGRILRSQKFSRHIIAVEERRYDEACAKSDAAREAYEMGRDGLGRFTGRGGPQPGKFKDYLPGRKRDWAYDSVVAMVRAEWPHLVRDDVFSRMARWWRGLSGG